MNVLNHPALIALLQNAALLLALVVVFDLAAGRLPMRGRPLRQIAVGVLLGSLCVALIATAFRLESGIVFDTRSVLLSVSGLFFGALPTGVAMAIAAAFRLFKGGVGAWTGVSVTLATGAIGIAWRHLRKGRLQDVSARELYAFGIAVHLVMLALMLTLPWPSARHVLRGIGLPVLLVYPVAATALGLLLANRLRREETAAAYIKESKYPKPVFGSARWSSCRPCRWVSSTPPDASFCSTAASRNCSAIPPRTSRPSPTGGAAPIPTKPTAARSCAPGTPRWKKPRAKKASPNPRNST